MPTGLQFAYGIRRLLDSQQRFTRAGFPVYLRLRNFPDVQGSAAAQYGFAPTPTGVASGTNDILISPRPSTSMVSQHSIGMSEGKLRFGARIFLVSHTFVRSQMQAQAVGDPTLIWRAPNVVGILYQGLLHDIVQYVDEEAAGQPVSWVVTCNSNEVR